MRSWSARALRLLRGPCSRARTPRQNHRSHSRRRDLGFRTPQGSSRGQRGVHDLVWLERAEVFALEPLGFGSSWALSPSTGIIDSHAFMPLRRDIEDGDAHVVLRTPVLSGRVLARGIELTIGHAEPVTALCRTVINARSSRRRKWLALTGVPPTSIPGQYFSKGHYFVLSGRSPFSSPGVPAARSRRPGVHVTLDLAKQARFGPDVASVSSVDYAFDEQRAAEFWQSDPQLLPGSRRWQPAAGLHRHSTEAQRGRGCTGLRRSGPCQPWSSAIGQFVRNRIAGSDCVARASGVRARGAGLAANPSRCRRLLSWSAWCSRKAQVFVQ